MKTSIVRAMLCVAVIMTISCSNSSDEKTHLHDDGTSHADHDTTKPAQQEFSVGDSAIADTTKEHSHADGKKHSH
jgi:hypothetical protein